MTVTKENTLQTGTEASETYIIGVEEVQYLPHWGSDGGEYIGCGRIILDAFAEYANLRFIYRPLPVRRLYNDYIGKEKLDFKFPDAPHWKQKLRRGKRIYYSEIVWTFTGATVVRKENVGKGMESVTRLGAFMGFTPSKFMDRINAGKLEVERSPSVESLIRMCLKGRVDAIDIDLCVFYQYISNSRELKESLAVDPELPYDSGEYMLSTIRHPGLIQRFNAFLAERKGFVRQVLEENGALCSLAPPAGND